MQLLRSHTDLGSNPSLASYLSEFEESVILRLGLEHLPQAVADRNVPLLPKELALHRVPSFTIQSRSSLI